MLSLMTHLPTLRIPHSQPHPLIFSSNTLTNKLITSPTTYRTLFKRVKTSLYQGAALKLNLPQQFKPKIDSISCHPISLDLITIVAATALGLVYDMFQSNQNKSSRSRHQSDGNDDNIDTSNKQICYPHTTVASVEAT